VRVIGEVFTLSDDGMELLTSTSTFAELGLPAQPSEFHVVLRPGTSTQPYLNALNSTLRPAGAEARVNQSTLPAGWAAKVRPATALRTE